MIGKHIDHISKVNNEEEEKSQVIGSYEEITRTQSPRVSSCKPWH
jgi:hypothetical protein